MQQHQPICFRLTSDELEMLSSVRNAQESINQCAARLVREALGISPKESDSAIRSTYLDTRFLDEKTELKAEIEEMIDEKINAVTAHFALQLGLLENFVRDARVTRTYNKRKPKQEET